MVFRCLVVLLMLAVAACAAQSQPDGVGQGPKGEVVDQAVFWRYVDRAREAADGDPEAMAEALQARLGDAHDTTLRGFQERLVEAHQRLYTWRHGDAAEMICGFVSDDVFTDWRSWVISLGEETFDLIAADPDNLADVADLAGGCEGGGEVFGAAVSNIYDDRGLDDDTLPLVEPLDPPRGERLTDHKLIRAALPRLSARIPDDGLGKDPRQFEEHD